MFHQYLIILNGGKTNLVIYEYTSYIYTLVLLRVRCTCILNHVAHGFAKLSIL